MITNMKFEAGGLSTLRPFIRFLTKLTSPSESLSPRLLLRQDTNKDFRTESNGSMEEATHILYILFGAQCLQFYARTVSANCRTIGFLLFGALFCLYSGDYCNSG